MADPCFPGSVAPVELSYFSSAVSLCLAVIITTTNASVIIAVAKDPLKKLRSPFAFFLANAAISDCVVGAFAMPISTVFHYREAERKINPEFIYILHLSYFISATASLASMVAMAIDRHNSLVSIRVRRPKLPLRYCITVSSLVWIVAFGFSGFYFLTGFVTLVLVYVNIAFVSSFGITLITYVKVIRKMRKTTRVLNENKANNERGCRAALRENKVTKVFMSMLLAFLSVYFPTFIFIYLLQFCLSCPCSTRHVFRDLVFLLVSAGSATNPIVCIMKMPVLRQSIYAILSRQEVSPMPVSNSYDTANNCNNNDLDAFTILSRGDDKTNGEQGTRQL